MGEAITEFRSELLAQIKNEAMANNEFDQIQFLISVTSELEIFEICPAATPCFFERIGKRNRKLAVHGYNITDFDNTLHLYYADYSGESDISTINNATFEDCVKKCIAFVEDALSKSIEETVEISDPGNELANLIRTEFDSFERIKIYVVSDRLRSDRFKTVDNHSAAGKQTFAIPIDISYYHDVVMSRDTGSETVIHASEFDLDGIEATEISNTNEDYCKSYLGIIPGRFLAEIYKKYGSDLLESNVRSFLSVRTGTNKGIKKTIETQPEMFFAYNNGVAITATRVEYDKKTKLISSFTNLQIVNGGQTTVSLYNTLGTTKETNLDLISVPMKLSVVSAENASEVVQNISRYANTQNSVKESDLDSNTVFQKRMEQFSRRVMVPRSGDLGSRKWYYERTRGQYAQEISRRTGSTRKAFVAEYAKERVIDKIAFSKFRYTYELKPHLVSKGGQTCYKKFSDSIEEAWNNGKSENYGESYYKETIAIAILYRSVYKEIPQCGWFNGSFRAQIANYSISKLIDLLEKVGHPLNMNLIWNEQGVHENIIKQIMKIGENFLEYLKEKGNEGINPTQWCKQEKCWEYVQKMNVSMDETIYRYCISKEENNQRQILSSIQQKSEDETDDLNKLKITDAAQWTRIRTKGLRLGMSNTEAQIIAEVINYLKDPENMSIHPNRVKKALEIKTRYE